MADKEKDGGKADKAERAAKVDKSPEAPGPRREGRGCEGQGCRQEGRPRPGREEAARAGREVTPRLRTHFDEVIRKALTEQFGYKNPMQVPRLDKIVLNMGIGEAVADRKKVEQAAEAMAAIAGQKPVITKSRKSIATYKLRDGQAIGCKVTLRKARMYEFLDRLVNIALPRVPATSAASIRRASTAAATIRSASRSTSFSRRSTTTRRRTSGAWTSRSAPPRAPTTRRARC